MVFGSWQEQNWDPAIGSNAFDEFCKEITHSHKSIDDVLQFTGVDPEDMAALLGFPLFDFALLNYAGYVRKVSGFGVWWFPVLTDVTEHPSNVPEGQKNRSGEIWA